MAASLFSTSFVSVNVLVVCSDFCVSDDVLLFEFELSSTDVGSILLLFEEDDDEPPPPLEPPPPPPAAELADADPAPPAAELDEAAALDEDAAALDDAAACVIM